MSLTPAPDDHEDICGFRYDPRRLSQHEAAELIFLCVAKFHSVPPDKRIQRLLDHAARIRSDPRWAGEPPKPRRRPPAKIDTARYKRCRECEQKKHINAFAPHSNAFDRRQKVCRVCRQDRAARGGHAKAKAQTEKPSRA
ncbi:MAG: hypothetical protein ACE5HA_03335 [Anaerolineae bacterium]